LLDSGLYVPSLKAGFTFLNHALTDPEDRVFIVPFPTVPKVSGWMTKDELRTFKVNVNPGGTTAMYDAVYSSCHDRMTSDRGKPIHCVLVILSDGEDNQSHVDRAQAIAESQISGTMIFSINTGNSPLGDKVLEQFASETGVYVYRPVGAKGVSKAFASIQAKIEQTYVVKYRPDESGRPGEFRAVELKIQSEKKLKVYAPKGYYVPTTVQ
jgi:Ca-activated chloride channel homolog